ncbi:MAG: mechanosensitive ion channel domain-containing protein [Betaproteobacteria bacterium]
MPSIDFSRLEDALATTRGWVELGLLVACVAAAWFVHLRFGRRYVSDPRAEGVALGVFPIVLLVMVLVARAGFGRSGPMFFLDLAIPLAIALAVIRLLVYAVRRLSPRAAWLKGPERLIAFTIWAAVALYFLGVTAEVVAALESVRFPLGNKAVSLYTVGQGLLVVAITVAIALWLSGFIEKRLVGTALDANMRVVLAKFLRVLIVVVGVLISLPAIGIDLTLLSVFGGALGVGIGLGLQKLAANYIAGFAILLDKSIKLGDVVTADGRHGEVARFTSRYVVVRQHDGVEAIVPNETLVTTTVLNHANVAALARLVVPVRVAYGADIERALELLLDAARGQSGVLLVPEHAPHAFVTDFGDTGIGLELTLWWNHAEGDSGPLRSAVHRQVFASFAKAGIEMAAQRRELWLQGDRRSRVETPGVPPQAS